MQVASPTDAELVKAIADGNPAALRELYDRHAHWLLLRLGRRCSDADAVNDALQDAFVAVWRKPGRYEASGDVAAWLWGIAIRRLIDSLRRRPRPLTLIAREQTEPSAEEQVLLGIEHGDLGGALNRLSPELRAVVQATVLDGLTTSESAALLGIPPGTVKTRMMRARAQLREEFA